MSNRRRNTSRKGGDWAEAFLAGFRDTGTVKGGCAQAGIERSTAYRRRHADEAFALAWHDVDEEVTDALEAEAKRRAADGVLKPVYYQGQAVGAVKEFSDTLLIFLLKARRPEKYRERYEVQHGGRLEHSHAIDTAKLSDDDLAQLESILARAA